MARGPRHRCRTGPDHATATVSWPGGLSSYLGLRRPDQAADCLFSQVLHLFHVSAAFAAALVPSNKFCSLSLSSTDSPLSPSDSGLRLRGHALAVSSYTLYEFQLCSRAQRDAPSGQCLCLVLPGIVRSGICCIEPRGFFFETRLSAPDSHFLKESPQVGGGGADEAESPYFGHLGC